MTETVRIAIAFLIGLAIIAAAALLTLAEARAHDAPLGWTYPMSCCSGVDCREEPDAAVREEPQGFQIVSTGEVIPYTDRRVRESPDGRWHLCWSGARFDEGRILCVFVPPRAF